MPETKSYESIAANVAAVRENMRQAAEAAGRDPQDITLVAATKVQTSDTIRNAIRAGITICGENRVQELVAHLEDNAYEGAKVHFIGHLQTNKVKFVVGKVDMIESIDSERLMDAVEKQAAKLNVTQDILLARPILVKSPEQSCSVLRSLSEIPFPSGCHVFRSTSGWLLRQSDKLPVQARLLTSDIFR